MRQAPTPVRNADGSCRTLKNFIEEITDLATEHMKQYLAVSAIGSDRPGMVHELTRVISDCGGNIAESRMAALGSEFAMLLLVNGNWHSLARIESELTRLAENGSYTVHVRRTEPRAARAELPAADLLRDRLPARRRAARPGRPSRGVPTSDARAFSLQ